MLGMKSHSESGLLGTMEVIGYGSITTNTSIDRAFIKFEDVFFLISYCRLEMDIRIIKKLNTIVTQLSNGWPLMEAVEHKDGYLK